MSITMFDASVPLFVQGLNQGGICRNRGAHHSEFESTCRQFGDAQFHADPFRTK